MRKSWFVFGLALLVMGLTVSAGMRQASYFSTTTDPTFHATVWLPRSSEQVQLSGRADGREITTLHNIVYRGNVVIALGDSGATIRADRAVLNSHKDEMVLSGNVRLSLK